MAELIPAFDEEMSLREYALRLAGGLEATEPDAAGFVCMTVELRDYIAGSLRRLVEKEGGGDGHVATDEASARRDGLGG